jgi:hypothetical protein
LDCEELWFGRPEARQKAPVREIAIAFWRQSIGFKGVAVSCRDAAKNFDERFFIISLNGALRARAAFREKFDHECQCF